MLTLSFVNSQASPRIRFNKDGTLLAVSANENGIKILANTDGIRLLRTFDNLSFDASRTSEAVTKVTLLEIFCALSCIGIFETKNMWSISCLTCQYLLQPSVSPISAAAAAATSAGLSDRNSSVVTIAGMVCSILYLCHVCTPCLQLVVHYHEIQYISICSFLCFVYKKIELLYSHV